MGIYCALKWLHPLKYSREETYVCRHSGSSSKNPLAPTTRNWQHGLLINRDCRPPRYIGCFVYRLPSPATICTVGGIHRSPLSTAVYHTQLVHRLPYFWATHQYNVVYWWGWPPIIVTLLEGVHHYSIGGYFHKTQQQKNRTLIPRPK